MLLLYPRAAEGLVRGEWAHSAVIGRGGFGYKARKTTRQLLPGSSAPGRSADQRSGKSLGAVSRR